MFDFAEQSPQSAVIKVIGIGGGGGNAINHMIINEIENVDFICANTDAQALTNIECNNIIQLGRKLTKGLGAGADPEIGRQAAIEDKERIVDLLSGADMVFITAGMGGGTGTGASPVIAEVAKELGILTVAVVTKPFPFEGRKRMLIAEAGIKALQENVDSLVIIPNEKLLAVLGKSTSLMNAFSAANGILLGAVQGITELITCPGMINVDFADVRTVMSEMGMAVMGIGKAKGENRALEAAEQAIRSPLLEEVNLLEAKGILVNITAGLDLSLGEFSEVGDAVAEFASDDATVVVGTVINTELFEEIRVTLVVTGLGGGTEKVIKPIDEAILEEDYAQLSSNLENSSHLVESVERLSGNSEVQLNDNAIGRNSIIRDSINSNSSDNNLISNNSTGNNSTASNSTASNSSRSCNEQPTYHETETSLAERELSEKRYFEIPTYLRRKVNKEYS